MIVFCVEDFPIYLEFLICDFKRFLAFVPMIPKYYFSNKILSLINRKLPCFNLNELTRLSWLIFALAFTSASVLCHNNVEVDCHLTILL
jgi:hypothetical protein